MPLSTIALQLYKNHPIHISPLHKIKATIGALFLNKFGVLAF